MKAKQRVRGILLISVIAIPFLISGKIAWSQVTAGAIRGVATDPSNAVLPDIEIEATNLTTNLKFTSTSTEAGTYVLGNLPIGDYKVVFRKTGFKQAVVEKVNVGTATTTTLNIQLQLGEIAQQVTVEESVAPFIQTDNAEVSTVVENRVVMDLPLQVGGAGGGGVARRQAENFIFLTPGVTGDTFSKSFNGSPDLSQVAVVDGIPYTNAEVPGRFVDFSPPFE
jgi:hypothetical protein